MSNSSHSPVLRAKKKATEYIVCIIEYDEHFKLLVVSSARNPERIPHFHIKWHSEGSSLFELLHGLLPGWFPSRVIIIGRFGPASRSTPHPTPEPYRIWAGARSQEFPST
jgi:hypothetical protein